MPGVPDFLTTFNIANEFAEEWLDSYDPSVKTFASNFCINVMSCHDFDCTKIVETEDFGVLMIKMRIIRILNRLNSSTLYNLHDTIKEFRYGNARAI